MREFRQRDELNADAKETERLERVDQRTGVAGGAFRAGDGTLKDHTPTKDMKDHIFVSDHDQVILSNHEPDAIEKKIVEILS